MKSTPNRNITEEILNHIFDITSGECKITEEKILNEKDKDLQLILSGLLHLHEDIQYQLELLRKNEELEKLNKQLKIKNYEMEQFAYIASHDLQEPVRTISNFAKLLSTNYAGKFDETADKSFQFIIEASDRMSSLIKGLLDYSRIGRELYLKTVDCNKLVEETIDDLSTRIEETQAKLKLERLPEVLANPTDLRLVFQNLINNAIKFRKEGLNPSITISAIEQESMWEFSCKDNGIGIAPEHRNKIFQIFQRLHNRKAYEGTGIGLSHCRKIVELHGGEIWVESQLNEGSTFYFTLPKP